MQGYVRRINWQLRNIKYQISHRPFKKKPGLIAGFFSEHGCSFVFHAQASRCPYSFVFLYTRQLPTEDSNTTILLPDTRVA